MYIEQLLDEKKKIVDEALKKDLSVYFGSDDSKLYEAMHYSLFPGGKRLRPILAILINEVSPYILLSDKGTQFYNSTKNKKGKRTLSLFEQECKELNINFWTSRRNHPQTNGKMERWFGSMKARFKRHPDESLQEFVEWYNKERIHDALDNRTPEDVYWENL